MAVANPRHTDTAAMLARIKVMEKKGPTLQDKYAGLVLEKIDFADVTVPEALQGLQMMAKGASDGKVVPNFILRGEKTMTQTINLSLANIPLDQAIAYVAQLSSTPYWYEEHAVVFSAAGN